MPPFLDSATSPSGALNPALQESLPSPQKPERLRVQFYSFFPGGGIGRYTHELMKRLACTKGIDAELVCLPSFEWLEDAKYPVWPKLYEIGHSQPWRRRARFLAGQLTNPRRLLQRAHETSADIIHLSNINHLSFPLWGRLLDRSHSKLVATAHDVRRAKAVISRRYEDRQLRSFYRRADALFVHSETQVDELIGYAGVAPDRIHVVPHGPYDYGPPTATRSALRKRLGWPEEKQVALFFGALRDDKNLDLLLRGIASHGGCLHLAVVGRGGGVHRGIAQYRRIAAQLGLSQSVTFDDRYVPEEEVPDLFEACDWVALPYSRTFTSQSGVLNVAMQYRRPVLASAAGTLAETLSQFDLGVSIEPDDIDALGAGVGLIFRRVANNDEFEFAAYLEAHSWRRNVERTVSVYRTLCRTNSSPASGSFRGNEPR